MSEQLSPEVSAEAEISLPSLVSKLRVMGIIEGISTLVLFGVAIPLKYIWKYDMAVTIVGGNMVVYLLFICSWAFW